MSFYMKTRVSRKLGVLLKKNRNLYQDEQQLKCRDKKSAEEIDEDTRVSQV